MKTEKEKKTKRQEIMEFLIEISLSGKIDPSKPKRHDKKIYTGLKDNGIEISYALQIARFKKSWMLLKEDGYLRYSASLINNCLDSLDEKRKTYGFDSIYAFVKARDQKRKTNNSSILKL